MAQVAHNPQTGEYMVKEYGGQWQPASEAEARAASATGALGFGGKAAAGALLAGVDTAGMALEAADAHPELLAPPVGMPMAFDPLGMLAALVNGPPQEQGPIGQLGTGMREAAAPDLAAIRERDPVAFWSGQLAPLVTGVPGMARGGMALMGTAGRGVAGVLPTAVKNVASDFIGSTVAAIKSTAGRVRAAGEGAEAFNARTLAAGEGRGLSAQAVGADAGTFAEPRYLPGVMTAEEAAAARIPTTEAGARLLDATASGFDDAAEALQAENLASGQGFLGQYDDYLRVTEAQDRRFVERVGEEVGLPDVQTGLTDEALVPAREANSEAFNRVFEGEDLSQANWKQVQDMHALMTQNAAADAAGSLRSIEKQVADLTKVSDPRDFADVFQGLRSKISRNMVAAAGDNPAAAKAMGSMRDLIDDVAAKALGPEKQAALEKARVQWRVLHVLGKSGVRNAHGQINPRTFSTQYRATFPEKRTFRRGGNDFERFMDTVSALQHSAVGNSGTAARLGGMGLLKAAGTAGGILGGASAAFNLLN